MGLLEQQWVTVQQKTFTKWYDLAVGAKRIMDGLTRAVRLNSKVASRDVAVNDLVTDLSDGVGHTPLSAPCSLALGCAEH